MKKIYTTIFGCCLLAITFCAFAQLPTNFKHIYFFGDSLSDMGNYTNPDCPRCYNDPSAPVTNWDEGKETITAKETWTNFFAQKYGLSSANSNTNGNDWAVSGATTKATLTQAETFYNKINGHLNDSSSTLIVVWAGPNDFLDLLKNNPNPDKNTIIKTIANGMWDIMGAINWLYDAGGRNFLVIGMPDISKTPIFQNPVHPFVSDYSKRTQMQEICQAWNSELFTRDGQGPIPSLYATLPGIHIYTFNLIPLLGDLVTNPTKYGFPATINVANPQEACQADSCKNNQLEWYFAHNMPIYGTTFDDPDQFIFYDAIHPTTHTHMILADHVYTDATLFQ